MSNQSKVYGTQQNSWGWYLQSNWIMNSTSCLTWNVPKVHSAKSAWNGAQFLRIIFSNNLKHEYNLIPHVEPEERPCKLNKIHEMIFSIKLNHEFIFIPHLEPAKRLWNPPKFMRVNFQLNWIMSSSSYLIWNQPKVYGTQQNSWWWYLQLNQIMSSTLYLTWNQPKVPGTEQNSWGWYFQIIWNISSTSYLMWNQPKVHGTQWHW